MTNKKIVILPCAGVGSRFSSVIPKQYMLIDNKPVLMHTLDIFLSLTQVDQIIIVTAVDDDYIDKLAGPDLLSSNQRLQILKIGGLTRAHTVKNAVNKINGAQDDDWLLVHDVARCCVSKEVILRMFTELEHDYVGGILAINALDTIKQSWDGIVAHKTLDRKYIYQAQTPQMFRFGVLKNALNRADLGLVTDEASAVEQINLPVKLIEGERTNIKITYPCDLKLAEVILKK